MKMIRGLEPLYGPQKWNPGFDKLCEDPFDSTFLFNGSFDGVAEIAAAEELYAVVRRVRPTVAVEVGTADGFTAAFIARALADNGNTLAHLWTCEIDLKRSTGAPRPWPKLWADLDLAQWVTPVLGDSRRVETWERAGLPPCTDFLFIDGDHATETVLAEWSLLGRRLRAGGVACFHDTKVKELGVRAAIDRIAAETPGCRVTELRSSRGLTMIETLPGPEWPPIEYHALDVHTDDRGWLFEVVHGDDAFVHGRLGEGQVYVVGSFRAGTVRAFHKHKELWDYFCIVSGRAKFALVDERSSPPRAATYVLTGERPGLLVVPPGVQHGWMALEDDTVLLSVASHKYCRENPDETRVPPDCYDALFGGSPWVVKGH